MLHGRWSLSSPPLKRVLLCLSSMRRADGHRDRSGRLQQHLPLGSNKRVPPEIDTFPRHRSQKHAGNVSSSRCHAGRDLVVFILLSALSRQVSVIQYGVNPKFELKLNQYKTKDEVMTAASKIIQVYGTSTNTFRAIKFARLVLH